MALLSAGATHNYANIKLVKTKERGAVGCMGGGGLNEIFCLQNDAHFFLQPTLQCEKDRDSSEFYGYGTEHVLKQLRIRIRTAKEENKRRCRHDTCEKRIIKEFVWWCLLGDIYFRHLLQFLQMAHKTNEQWRHRRYPPPLAISFTKSSAVTVCTLF